MFLAGNEGMVHYRQFHRTRHLKFFTAAMGMAGSGDLPPVLDLLPAKTVPSREGKKRRKRKSKRSPSSRDTPCGLLGEQQARQALLDELMLH